MTIYARTAHFNKTIYDPYINVLRATTEAMAAAIGGADAVQVEAFDRTYREPDETSLRLARNTQLILKQEAWLDRTVDAAGGSYYLENLTDSLAREAWKLFQEIEAAGGFLQYSASGALGSGHRQIARRSRGGCQHAPDCHRGNESISQFAGAHAGQNCAPGPRAAAGPHI